MDEQMEMALGQAETVDPVSGNDVPPGSLPEEVRDDIDAKLSEGEYVVPADVVRFFGVKYFEDLRTEAKMGLQQMDADGRIGGEPVQEQPQGQDDSMDVAELKAALSSSGMYAGGLTDGNSLDNFIDDASRSPMVNGRMRAGGATVKMAVGGLIPTGTYGDATKVDGIIKQLMTAANNDPNLMQKLSDKGIMINKTGADKKSVEMQQANKPEEPLKAYTGLLVGQNTPVSMGTTEQTDPFDTFRNFGTLGGSSFSFGAASDEEKDYVNQFLDPTGIPKVVILIDPDGKEIPVAWNTNMEIPPGFTIKDDLSYESYLSGASKTEASGLTAVPYSMGTDGDESGPDLRKGDGSRFLSVAERDDAFRKGEPYQNKTNDGGIGFLLNPEIKEKSPKELAKMLETGGNLRKTGSVITMVAGINPIVGLAANAAMAMQQSSQKRQVYAELASRKVELEKNNTWNVGTNKEHKLIETLLNKTDPRKKVKTNKYSGRTTVEERGPLGNFFASIGDAIFGEVSGGKPSSVADATSRVATTQNLNNQVVEQRTINADNKRKADAAAKAAADRAARASAQASAQAARVRGTTGSYYTGQTGSKGQQYFTTSGGGGGYTDAAGINQYTGGGNQGWTNAGNEAAKAARDPSRAATGLGPDYFTGGLVSMPAAKQNNKKTTQRRKGLGTRP